jgi:predicted negative regulator of RcsB-dependent stress response
MQKNTKYIIAGGLVLIAGIFGLVSYQRKQQRDEYALLLKKIQQKNSTNNYVPQQNTPDWYQWIQYAIGAYGQVSSLWEPGGLFYGNNVPEPGSGDLQDILKGFA